MTRDPAARRAEPARGGQHSFIDDLPTFIDDLPKAELHLHLEGTLEPALKSELARRNSLPLPPAYSFSDLTSFLAAYYGGIALLRTEQDFYDLAMAYFRKASAQHVVYAEVFFDPQAHTSRGAGFGEVIAGFDRARVEAGATLGLQAQLIMCFLRDQPVGDAMRTLEQAAPYRDKIIGVGLDSDERDNPPIAFAEVFAAARAEGYRLTVHCDVDQADSVDHIWQCVDDIGVDRIDHGVNCMEDPALIARLHHDGIGLTVCPISNRCVTDGLKAAELTGMLQHELKATVNSDDPAYFGGYITENLQAVSQQASLTTEEIVRLTRNAFDIAWLPEPARQSMIAKAFTR
jgi:adenosine deaminase